MAKTDSLLAAVQHVLFREWDPIGINRNAECRDEYDSYAPTISRWLRQGVDEFKLVAHLEQLQRVSMGISDVDSERDRKVARTLLSLVPGRRSK